MADTTKKQVIIDVKVERDKQIEELLKQMSHLQKETMEIDKVLNGLHEDYKKGHISIRQYADAYVRLREERKSISKQVQSLSRQEQNLVATNIAVSGSLQAMRKELAFLKENATINFVVGSEGWEKEVAKITELHNKVSKAEQQLGVFSRNVGNYASGFSPLSFQIQQLARELPSLTIGLPQFFLAISNNLPMLGDAIAQTKAEIADAKKEGREVVPLGKQIVKSIFSWQTALVAVVTVLSVFGKEITQFIGGLFKGKDAIDAFRKSASEMVGGVAKERAELAALFNALALAEEGTANYVAVRNTILDKYGDLLESEREEVRNLTAIGDAYDVIAKKITGKAIAEGFASQIEEQSKEFGDLYKTYYEDLLPSFTEKFGADGISNLIEFLGYLTEGTEESLSKAEQLANAFNFTIQTQGGGTQLVNALTQEISALGNVVDSEYAIDKIAKKFADLNDQIKATTEAQQTLLKEFNAEAPDTKGGKGGEDDEYNRAKRSLELEQKLDAEKLKSQEQYQYDSTLSAEENDALEFAHQTKHNRDMFELEQRHKEELLKLDEQYDKISAEDAAATRKLYAQESATFNAEQLAETNKFLREQEATMLKRAEELRKEVLKANEQTEIAATKAKWSDYRTSLGQNSSISATERGDLTALSVEQEEAEILAIKRKYRQSARRLEQEIGRQIREDVEELYYDDLRQFSDSEKERLLLAIETQEAIIKARKEAGLDTYEQENELMHLRKQLANVEYQDQLAMAWKEADEQYNIKRQMLLDQLELYKDNAAERARIEQELYNLEADYNTARIDNLMEYANHIGSIFGSVNDIAQTYYNSQLEAEKNNNESAEKNLDKRLNAGLISERQYNKAKTKLEEDFAKKQAEIQRKQAIFERSLAIFNIGVQTAEGVMRALAVNAANPVRGGILAGLITASGVAQTAAVLAEPLPMAREGGIISGATHEQGGVLVNTENKERIISAKPSQVFPELLNLISYIGKHAHIPQSGYAFRGIANSEATAEQIGRKVGQTIARQSEEQAQIIGAEVGREVAKELRNLEVVTTVEAFEKAKNEYDRVVNSAKA